MKHLVTIVLILLLIIALSSDYLPLNQSLVSNIYAKSAVSFKLNGHSYSYRGQQLQKGLLMSYKGKEMTAGALGFGVPVIRADGKHYFASSGNIEENKYELEKVFNFDTMMYKDNEGYWRFKKNKKSYGKINVKYTILPGKIRILADFNSILLDYDDIVMYNEQNGNNFPIYMGSSLEYINYKNFSWKTINTNCSEMFQDDVGYFLTENKNVGFGVPCRSGARLVRSRSSSNFYNHSGLHLVVTNGGKMFYYNIYYDTPQNQDNWWEKVEKAVPIK